MENAIKLPTVIKRTSANKIMKTLQFVSFLPNGIESICSIVESNNNKEKEMNAISLKAEIEKLNIEKSDQENQRKWNFAKSYMEKAFEDRNLSGEQIIKLAEVLTK